MKLIISAENLQKRSMSAISPSTTTKSCETIHASQATSTDSKTCAAWISHAQLQQKIQSLEGRVSVVAQEDVSFEIDLFVDMANASVSRTKKISAPCNSPEISPLPSREVPAIVIN